MRMMRYWKLERVLQPSSAAENPTSCWTVEGRKSVRRYFAAGATEELQAGLHYEAVDAENRILVPDIVALHGLRHRWFWQRRTHPYVPVWNGAKLPRDSLPAEENCRLLSLYMRPWTLYDAHVSPQTPLLTTLRASEESKDARCTYINGWNTFIHGGVATSMQRRYIQNILMATTAKMIQDDVESSSDESDLDYNRKDRDIGNMGVVQNTIQGLAANDEDLGRLEGANHNDSIALGRSLWQSPDLTPGELQSLTLSDSTYEVSCKDAINAIS